MSELRSAAESLRAEGLAELPDALAEEEFLELHAALELLEAERLRRLRDLERRRVFERDGYLSCAAWLVGRLRMDPGRARGDLRLARSLDEMPVARTALGEGQISLSHARVLASARDVHPEAFAHAEEQLVDAARVHTVRDLGRATGYWRQRVDSELLAGEHQETLRARRRLHVSPTFGGMVRVDGDLDPETGETVLTALGAVLDAETHSRTGEDDRTPAQRRADGLGELCRQWLDRADRPEVTGERPHVTVTVPFEALRARKGADSVRGSAPAEFDRVGPVSADMAIRLACDASVTRVVLSPRSEPLDVGRRTTVVPPPMRRAVIVRDRHCRFPGCDRPHSWCDAHHVVHWARGGRTSLDNLLLLCRRHHRLVHDRRGFTLELADGRPIFRRPDGSVLEGRAPPPVVAA